jgi:hypothetical protein
MDDAQKPPGAGAHVGDLFGTKRGNENAAKKQAEKRAKKKTRHREILVVKE